MLSTLLHMHKTTGHVWDQWTRTTSLYRYQTWPVVLCMYNDVLSIRNTSLYGSPPSSVVFGCTTATFGTEKQISMGPRHEMSFCACKAAWLAPELLVSMGSSPHLWFCVFKRATLGPELHVSLGPRHHLWLCAFKTLCLASEKLVSIGTSPDLWLLNVKQRRLNQNNKSLWVTNLPFCFVHAKLPD